MQLRTFISSFLIFALVDSLAGICDVNCRASAVVRAKVQPSPAGGHAAHHHHHPSHDMMASKHATTRQASSAQHSMSHRCCTNRGPVVSGPCSMLNSNALQEQRISPKSGRELVKVHVFNTHSPTVSEHVNPHMPVNLLGGSTLQWFLSESR